MEKRKLDKWDATIDFDEKKKLYVISFDGSGGAIVSDADLAKAEKKFVENMILADNIAKSLYFHKYGSFPSKN